MSYTLVDRLMMLTGFNKSKNKCQVNEAYIYVNNFKAGSFSIEMYGSYVVYVNWLIDEADGGVNKSKNQCLVNEAYISK